MNLIKPTTLTKTMQNEFSQAKQHATAVVFYANSLKQFEIESMLAALINYGNASGIGRDETFALSMHHCILFVFK